jgi:hypothetical protein
MSCYDDSHPNWPGDLDCDTDPVPEGGCFFCNPGISLANLPCDIINSRCTGLGAPPFWDRTRQPFFRVRFADGYTDAVGDSAEFYVNGFAGDGPTTGRSSDGAYVAILAWEPILEIWPCADSINYCPGSLPLFARWLCRWTIVGAAEVPGHSGGTGTGWRLQCNPVESYPVGEDSDQFVWKPFTLVIDTSTQQLAYVHLSAGDETPGCFHLQDQHCFSEAISGNDTVIDDRRSTMRTRSNSKTRRSGRSRRWSIGWTMPTTR